MILSFRLVRSLSAAVMAAAITLLLPSLTWASDWKVVIAEQTVVISIDRDTIKRSRLGIKVWYLYDFPADVNPREIQGELYRSILFQVLVNCEEGSSGMAQAIYYEQPHATGSVSRSFSEPNVKLEDDAPGSRGEYLNKVACSLASER